MKRKVAAALLCAAMSTLPCGLAHARPYDDVGSIDPNGDVDPSASRVQLPPDPEGKAVELRLAGKCDEAVAILRRLVEGDAIAQYNLGLCLIDLGKKSTDAQRSRALEHEGASWLVKAANANLPNAQSSLVSIYLDGSGVPKDPVEAAKWALLYQQNGTRMAIGLPGLSHDLRVRLDTELTQESWTQAQARASSWVPVSQQSGN
jgi:TPR repeat protein